MEVEKDAFPLRELHLFAGAGGGILGGLLCGHVPVCAVELEEYPRKILLQRQRDGHLPWFPVWGDVCTFDGNPWRGKVDVVCGGFPCQDISSAGKGQGISGSRSGLWREMSRIIGEVRPSFAFIENSPRLVSRGLDVVLADLAAMGYDAVWGVLGSDDVGACHHRKRMWILAYSDKSGLKKNKGVQSQISIQKHKTASAYYRLLSYPLREPIDGNFNYRGDDGLAVGVDRFAAIGNGQDPRVVRLAWLTLTRMISEIGEYDNGTL